MNQFRVSMKMLSVSTGAVLALSAIPSQAAIINIDNFDGWNQIGNVNFSSSGASLNSNSGISDNGIESFLGLPTGSLNNFISDNATVGSAIKKDITVQAGDVLQFNWKFSTSDYIPYNDFSFYSIDSSPFSLADVRQVGSYGQTQSQTSYTFTADGTYSIGFGILNARDSAVNSNLTIGQPVPDPVPEPITILGSLAAGSFGISMRRKYKQQQKA